MSIEPVLKVEEFDFEALSEYELDSALGYAHTCYERDLDRSLLRIVINTVHARRERGTRLALLAAHVVRETIPPPKRVLSKEEREEYELTRAGWKGAVMKAMSIRRVWQIERDKRKRAEGKPIPVRPKQTEYPVEQDPRKKGQLRLFS